MKITYPKNYCLPASTIFFAVGFALLLVIILGHKYINQNYMWFGQRSDVMIVGQGQANLPPQEVVNEVIRSSKNIASSTTSNPASAVTGQNLPTIGSFSQFIVQN
ncbi:MAG: hypothetical protein V1807_00650 [Patescibacteria group bacterium]